MTGRALPRRRWWRHTLDARRPGRGRELARALDEEYRSLLAHRPVGTDDDRAVRFHLRQSILPALAAYRVLARETGRDGPDAEVLAEVTELVAAQMRPILTVAGLLDRSGLPFAVTRRLLRRGVRALFAAPAFEITWHRDDAQALRFDVTGCFYLRVLRHYDAAELTPVFCRGDELAFGRMPRTLRFDRTGTLAQGAPRCDFSLRPAERP